MKLNHRLIVANFLMVALILGWLVLLLPHFLSWWSHQEGLSLNHPPQWGLSRKGIQLRQLEILAPVKFKANTLTWFPNIPGLSSGILQVNQPQLTVPASPSKTPAKPLTESIMEIFQSLPELPFPVILDQGTLILEDMSLALPFKAVLTPQSDDQIHVLITLSPRGQPLTLQGSINRKEATFRGNLHWLINKNTLSMHWNLQSRKNEIHLILAGKHSSLPGKFQANIKGIPDGNSLTFENSSLSLSLNPQLSSSLPAWLPKQTTWHFPLTGNLQKGSLQLPLLSPDYPLNHFDWTFKGSLTGLCQWNLLSRQLPEISLTLEEGELNSGDLRLEGLSTHLQLNPGWPPGTLPRQHLSIDNVQLDPLSFDPVSLYYQVFGSHLYIEGGEAELFGGQIQLAPLDLSLDAPTDLHLEIYFNQIPIQKLLEAYNSSRLEVTGTFSGLIPIHWKQGHFTIGHTSLYTSPGGGRFKVLDSQVKLADAVPVGHPYKEQLKLADASLRDMAYEYIQLKIEGPVQESQVSFLLKERLEDTSKPPVDLTIYSEGPLNAALAGVLNMGSWADVLGKYLADTP